MGGGGGVGGLGGRGGGGQGMKLNAVTLRRQKLDQAKTQPGTDLVKNVKLYLNQSTVKLERGRGRGRQTVRYTV